MAWKQFSFRYFAIIWLIRNTRFNLCDVFIMEITWNLKSLAINPNFDQNFLLYCKWISAWFRFPHVILLLTFVNIQIKFKTFLPKFFLKYSDNDLIWLWTTQWKWLAKIEEENFWHEINRQQTVSWSELPEQNDDLDWIVIPRVIFM